MWTHFSIISLTKAHFCIIVLTQCHKACETPVLNGPNLQHYLCFRGLGKLEYTTFNDYIKDTFLNLFLPYKRISALFHSPTCRHISPYIHSHIFLHYFTHIGIFLHYRHISALFHSHTFLHYSTHTGIFLHHFSQTHFFIILPTQTHFLPFSQTQEYFSIIKIHTLSFPHNFTQTHFLFHSHMHIFA